MSAMKAIVTGLAASFGALLGGYVGQDVASSKANGKAKGAIIGAGIGALLGGGAVAATELGETECPTTPATNTTPGGALPSNPAVAPPTFTASTPPSPPRIP